MGGESMQANYAEGRLNSPHRSRANRRSTCAGDNPCPNRNISLVTAASTAMSCALTTPMSSKGLEKHMAWSTARVERTLDLLVHLNKVQPLKRKGGKYALMEADLFSG